MIPAVSRLALAVVGVAVLSMANVVITPAGTAAWSGPQRLFEGRYGEVDAAVDMAGAVHAVATNDTGIWYLTTRSGSWTRKRVVATPAGREDQHVSIAVTPGGRPHIAFERYSCEAPCGGGHPLGVFYLKARGDGSFPATPTRVVGDQGGSPSIALHEGDVFIAYDRCSGPYCPTADVGLASRTDGTWKRRILVRGSDPALALTVRGRIRIAYERNGIRYLTLRANGSFSTERVQGTGAADRGPAIALSDGRVMVAWVRDDDGELDGGPMGAQRSADGWWTANWFTALGQLPIGHQVDITDAPGGWGLVTGRGPGTTAGNGVFTIAVARSGVFSAPALDTAARTGERGVAITRDGNQLVVLYTNAKVPRGIYLSRGGVLD